MKNDAKKRKKLKYHFFLSCPKTDRRTDAHESEYRGHPFRAS